MYIPSKMYIAVEGLIALAKSQRPCSRVRICKKAGISTPKYLEDIFNNLRKSNIISTRRGRGYDFIRPINEITMADIYESLFGCIDGHSAPGESLFSEILDQAKADFKNRLSMWSIEDLMQKEHANLKQKNKGNAGGRSRKSKT